MLLCQCTLLLTEFCQTEVFERDDSTHRNRLSDLADDIGDLLVPLIGWCVRHANHVIVTNVHHVHSVLKPFLAHRAFQS